MKKTVESKSRQKNQNFNFRARFRVISFVLTLITVSIACLGGALFASNSAIAVLQTDLNVTNEKLEAIMAENKTAASEIDALQSDLASTEEALRTLTAEFAAELALMKDALAQSQEEQESLENSLTALENHLTALQNSNQSALNEIDQLKSDIENAKHEIAALKKQLEEHQKENENKIRIYIDQGHNPTSYHNSGASGNGLYEQDITFLIGCLLADLLRADGRFEVQLSRPNKSVVLGTDNKSSLMARVEGAAAFEADYLISLHTNSFEQDTANGIEVYAAEKTSESYVFGETLLAGLIASTNLKDRGMRLNPDLDILEFSTMPAVLVEMGFISNSTDAALMSEHPELFAKGIYNGILEYFGLLSKTPAAT
jgi:N-acetylmuramoyl-L-alanine amidase